MSCSHYNKKNAMEPAVLCQNSTSMIIKAVGAGNVMISEQAPKRPKIIQNGHETSPDR